jgi:hypothetical protein
VSQILGGRQHYYITDDVDFCMEANRFLQDGYFDSQLGNLMPLAMAEALSSHVVLFRTDDDKPLYISPEHATERTLFLVYNPLGCGHYDAAIPFNCQIQEKPQPQLKCSCGVNNNTQSCCPTPRYSSRCPCFNNNKECTFLCRCKNCANPNGQKPPVKGRKRRAHQLQLQVPKSAKFANDRGEKLTEGNWSEFEKIVLNEIVAHTTQKDVLEIHKLYNDIVFYSGAPFCAFPLQHNIIFRQKSFTQVSAKLTNNMCH